MDGDENYKKVSWSNEGIRNAVAVNSVNNSNNEDNNDGGLNVAPFLANANTRRQCLRRVKRDLRISSLPNQRGIGIGQRKARLG